MARVYDLEQLIEPTLLGCDKARISIEVKILKFQRIFRENILFFEMCEKFRVSAFVTINLLLLQMNRLDILSN